ncbi:uncharacterized protein [Nicotiana tomentosiformis]|uniref:uncharacterized protein n=1 Tax=Nicotiana tomentosiformis TaxID=4098 RepID=UPI00388CD6F6
MEGVNVMVKKRRQRGQQVQHNQDQFEQSGSGYDQDDYYNDQSEEVQYVNNYQGQRSNAPNQQQWRSKGNNQNWGNQGQGNWNSGNNNHPNNWGNNNQNWGNQENNQGNWGGNNNSNWGGNKDQGGWNNNNQGNRWSGPQRPPMYEQPNNLPLYPSQGQSSSNNEMGQIETLNTRPKETLPSDTVVNPMGGNNTGHAMAVTTKSGRGGVASTSNPRKIVNDDMVVQDEDEPRNDENVNDEVRIDIDENVEET